MVLKLRNSRAVRFARENQMLLLAIACIAVVGLLSVIAQTGRTAPPEQVASNVTSTLPDLRVEENATPTPTNDTEVAAGPTISPTRAIGPFPPGRGTTTPLDDPTPIDPNAPYATLETYPGPDGPTPIGDFPTFEPFPTSISDNGVLPTFPPMPPPPPANPPSGSSRATSVPDETEPTKDTGGSNSTYPTPVDNEEAPTNIPVPTDSSGAEPTSDDPFPVPTDEVDETPDDGQEPPGSGLPTSEPEPTSEPAPTATPAPPPADYVTGNLHWRAADSPVYIDRDMVILAGASLTVDPGVELRLAPDASLIVDGVLKTNGTSANRVRVRPAGNGNWRSIVVNPGGKATLFGLDARQGGSGGVVVAALGGTTIIQDGLFEQNSGQILGAGGNLDIQYSSITGAAPVSVEVKGGGFLRLIGNTVVNTSSNGSNGVSISSSASDVNIDVQKNLFRSTSGNNVRAQFNVPLAAGFQCNTFTGGAVGLLVKSSDPSMDGSRISISGNSFIRHKSYGLASDIGIDGRNNWWGHESGPYHPQENGQGTGDAVGENVPFHPWLTARPACTP